MIVFTLGYIIFLFMSLDSSNNLSTAQIDSFNKIYIAIIVFYFGSRTVETAAEVWAKTKTKKE